MRSVNVKFGDFVEGPGTYCVWKPSMKNLTHMMMC